MHNWYKFYSWAICLCGFIASGCALDLSDTTSIDECFSGVKCSADVAYNQSATEVENFFIGNHIPSLALWDSSGGSDSVCAISFGILYCWGDNDGGQLGIGDSSTSNVTTPTQVEIAGHSSDRWLDISAKFRRICGIESGKLYCWGTDFMNHKTVTAPTLVSNSQGWHQVELGHYSVSCGLNTGQIYCWKNDLGTSGPATAVTLQGRIWSDIGVGFNKVCGISRTTLYCAGTNDVYSIANTETVSDLGTGWTEVSLGEKFGCGIRDEKLYCWGDSIHGALGRGDYIKHYDLSSSMLPIEHPAVDHWSDLSVGRYHGCALGDGHLYCWGWDATAALGNFGARNHNESIPTLVTHQLDWSHVLVGRYNTCAVADDELYCWGGGHAAYILGQGFNTFDESMLYTPVQLE